MSKLRFTCFDSKFETKKERSFSHGRFDLVCGPIGNCIGKIWKLFEPRTLVKAS